MTYILLPPVCVHACVCVSGLLTRKFWSRTKNKICVATKRVGGCERSSPHIMLLRSGVLPRLLLLHTCRCSVWTVFLIYIYM